MTQITSKTNWTIELSDEEYRIVTDSLKRTAKTPEQKSVYRAFAAQINGNAVTEDDFVIGDRVVLLDDLDSIDDEDGKQDFCGGDVCSILDVNNSQILVLNLTRPGTHAQGHWLPARYFSFDGPMISIDQVKDQLRDQISANEMSMTDFAKLLKTFSK